MKIGKYAESLGKGLSIFLTILTISFSDMSDILPIVKLDSESLQS